MPGGDANRGSSAEADIDVEGISHCFHRWSVSSIGESNRVTPAPTPTKAPATKESLSCFGAAAVF
jgi:hypothetical protein